MLPTKAAGMILICNLVDPEVAAGGTASSAPNFAQQQFKADHVS
jgi:hypothetical protein